MASDNPVTSTLHQLPLKRDGLVFDRLTEKEADAAARLVARAFATLEPTSVHSQVGEETLYRQFLAYIQHILAAESLSIICRDNMGQIIGAALCHDLRNQFDFFQDVDCAQFPNALEPHYALEMALFDMGFPTSAREDIAVGEGCVFEATGIDPRTSLQGIGQTLLLVTEQTVRDRGYRYGVTICLSPVTQYLAIRDGFEVIATIDYEDFEFKEERPFAGLRFPAHEKSSGIFPKGRYGAALMKKAYPF